MVVQEKWWLDCGMIRRIIFVVVIVTIVEDVMPLKIYDSLTHCYRRNRANSLPADSLQTLLELIRKVEKAYPTSIDMRMLSVSVLHRLRIDGIQKAPGVVETNFTIPYGVSGMMAPRFQLLLNLVPDTPNPINFTEILTAAELCTFHRLVSSTIETSVRGDEAQTCSPNLINSQYGQAHGLVLKKVTTFPNGKVLITPTDVSDCPQEYGVLRTFGYGSFSPGIVIGAIAAGLQPQIVPIGKVLMTINKETTKGMANDKFNKVAKQKLDLNNYYVSGIAGDLAEVCAYQAPYYGNNITVGFAGCWDDPVFPKARYLANNHYNLWQLTDSEILAGIDAYYLSTYIKSWVDKIQTFRLSQVIEMFYSPKGVPVSTIESVNRLRKSISANAAEYELDHEYIASANTHVSSSGNPYYDSYFDGHNKEDNLDNACERKRILERVSSHSLKEETFKIAQVLQLSGHVVEVGEDLLHTACGNAVDKFFAYARELLNKLPECKSIPRNQQPNLDLIMILDGFRTLQQTRKLVGAISEMIDVSVFGSFISVIHGGNSELLVDRTNSIFQLFEELQQYSSTNPTSFSLSNSLSKVVQIFGSSQYDFPGNNTGVKRARVVLVISQGQKINNDDFQNAEWLLSGSLQYFSDVYYIFVTNDGNAYRELLNRSSENFKASSNQYVIIESTDPEPKSFLNELEKVLRQIPKLIVLPKCNSAMEYSNQDGTMQQNRFEDYVNTNQANTYFLNPAHLVHISELRIKFEGVGYGSFTVCMARVTKICQSTSSIDLLQFNVSHPCESDVTKNCSGIIFTVMADSSKMRCTEADCRYPDQVRYIISFDTVTCYTDAVCPLKICDKLLLLAVVILLLDIF